MAYTPHESGTRNILVAGNRQVETLFVGEGTRPLVYLHGSGTTPADYPELFQNIIASSPNSQLIAPSTPGAGTTDPYRKGESMAEWLVSFLEASHVTDADIEDVTVVGHSHGGWLALKLAEVHPGLHAYTLGTPVGEMPETSALVRNLLSDHMKYVVNAARQGDVVPLRKTASQTLAASYGYLSAPDNAKLQLGIVEDHMADLATPESVAVRRAMFRRGQVSAAFYEFDNAVRPPKDWRGIVELPGGHMDPVHGPVQATARFIVAQVQAAAA